MIYWYLVMLNKLSKCLPYKPVGTARDLARLLH